jgi:hypothetical protein
MPRCLRWNKRIGAETAHLHLHFNFREYFRQIIDRVKPYPVRKLMQLVDCMPDSYANLLA